MKKLAAALLIASAGSAAAAAPPASRGPAISVETLKSVTQRLSSDEFEGRAPTTPGEQKSIAYISERFAAAGLKPGNKGSWFQPVQLVETIASPTPLTMTGGKTPLTFGYRTDMVAVSYQVQPKIE